MAQAFPREDRFRPRGTPRGSRVGRWRTLSLIAVHLAVVAHVAHWRLSGETISPMEPSEAMQTLELGWVNAGFLVLVGSILLTLLLGRFFCGWVCHFVAYQDLCGWILRRVGLRPMPVRSRLLVFVPFGLAFYMFVWPTLARLLAGAPAPDPQLRMMTERFWETFPGLGMAVVTILVGGFLVVYWLGAKGFCSYGCPYGAFFTLADRFAPMRIRVTDACDTCGQCTTVCTSNVRVHEEVAKYRRVVDPGCMKTLDCVSNCPKDALFYGVGRRPLAARSRRWVHPRPDFSWGEEIAMAAAFLLGLLAWRGLYGLVPLLLAVSLGVLVAASVVIVWRLLRQADLRFQHHQLKRAGRLTQTGAVLALTVGLFLAATAHAGVIRWHVYRGETLAQRGVERERPPQERRAALDASASWLEGAASLGLRGDASVHRMLGLVERERGRFAVAEAQLRRALELEPRWPQALVPLADLLALRGAWDEAEAALQEALAEKPGFGPALDRLRRYEERRSSGR